MRVHGVRPFTDPAESASGAGGRGGHRTLLVWAVGVAAALGGGYGLWQAVGEKGVAVQHADTDAKDLAEALSARGVTDAGLSKLLVADAAVERFAKRAASNQDSALSLARAIVKAFRARASRQAFVPWSLHDARDTPPMTAAAVASAIAKDGARHRLYPLEVAALGVAALRALDVRASLCETYADKAERAPLDPSGRLGYFVIALPQAKADEPRFFDAYGGRPEQATSTDCAVLSDSEAIGAALSLRALQRLQSNQDPAAALRDTDAAIALFPTSPSVRGARAAVLLANAATEPGQREFEAAAQMRPDGPRRNNLAMFYLATGDTKRATHEVSQALSLQPDFALAHLTLAAVHMAGGERELSRTELEKAEALDKSLPALGLAWAQYHQSAGETELAIAHAQRAIAARPGDPQAHLLLGSIYRQASRYEEMRGEARAVLALTPETQRARIRELVKRVLGPAAFEAEGATPSAGTLLPSPAPTKLRLQGGDLELDLKQ